MNLNEHSNIIFEEAPVSLWVEDFSQVKNHIEALRKKGISDFKTYFDKNPEAIINCFTKILITNINKSTLALFQASTKENLIKNIIKTFNKESLGAFKIAFLELINGQNSFSFEANQKTLNGNNIKTLIHWSIPQQYFDSWSTILVSMIDITEQEKAEMFRKESEEKFSKAFHTSLDLIAISSIDDGSFIDVNESFLQVLGYNRDEVINKSAQELDIWADLEKRKKIAKSLKQNGFSKDYEMLIRKKNGDTIVGLFSASMINLSDGPVLLTIMKDITERKRAEELLRIQRDLSIKIVEIHNLNELMHIILNATLNIESIDAGGVYFRDPETDELDLVVHQGLPEDFLKMASHYSGDTHQAELVKQGNPIHGHYEKLKLPLKKEGLKALSIIPIKHEKDVVGALNLASHTNDEFPNATHAAIESIAGIVGGAISRVKTETALHESREQYQLLVQNLPDGIIILQKGFIKFVNPVASETIGYSQDEIETGIQFIDIVHEEDKIKIMTKYKQYINEEDIPKTTQLNIISKNGQIVPIETLGIQIQYEGKPANLLSVRDITDRIKSEREKKELEERIKQSEKMEAVGQLAGGIAHDFNNQLAGIVGYADLLQGKLKDNSELAFYTENILKASKRAADLTSQLLAFARKGKYLSIPVDIHKTIYEVVTLLKHSIDKRITIKQHLDAHPPITTGDPTQLQNALLNLALNAKDAMPDGGDLIFATEITELDKSLCEQYSFDILPGTYLLVTVTDTGIGIPDEIQKQIFEPFFTTKQKGAGTGMGLAAVYGTIKNHKGGISVESQEGHETTFRLYLPLSKSIPEKIEEELLSLTLASNPANILLVDDEKMVCDTVSRMLETLGHKVIIAQNGIDAVNEYRHSWKLIDLVILDMSMPGMDGNDTFLEMRKINPDITALLSSGYSMDGEIEKILKKGIRGFIQKPFRQETLSQSIFNILNDNKVK